MKKLTSLMLGMGLVLGTAAVSFAAQAKATDSNKASTTTTTTTTKKMKKHHKKSAKKENASATSNAKPAPAK